MVLVLLVAGGVVVGYVLSDDDTDAGPHDHVSGSEPASAPESESTPAETTTEPATPPSDQYGIALGPEDAEDTIVVYEDLLCPPCARLHVVSDPLVQGARNGEFRLVVRFVNYLSRYGSYSAEPPTPSSSPGTPQGTRSPSPCSPCCSSSSQRRQVPIPTPSG
ncbi:DsbA family protein [Nocardioides sp. GXZ039]|uniref:DsbA family protein n=1 Tax=Nocardioides sp. GXZ039 TaxID=3136018 RepID=UPI0030F46681